MAKAEETEEAPRGYVENPNHVPNPTDAYGTLDTSGTAGAAHGRIEEVTPIFDVARQQDLATAAKALDPDDDSVDSSLVVIDQGQRLSAVDPTVDEERVKASAAKVADEPVDLTSARVTPPKAQAAESGPEAAETAASQSPAAEGAGATDGGGKPPTAAEKKAAAEAAKDDAKK